MTAWLIYEKAGAERNRGYIELHKKWGIKYGIEFSLILCDEGLPDGKPDFAIVRAMRPDIAEELESRGIPTFNNSHISRICNNKARTYEYLHKNNIPVIPWVSATQSDTPPKIENFPKVIKPCCGHGGAGVSIIRSDDEYEARRKEIAPDEYIIQELATEIGRDKRVYVIGNRIVASVQRIADGNDFRSNFSLGGKVEKSTLTKEEEALIGDVCKLFEFDLAGIDIMYHKGRAVINEIEDVVGSRMLYNTHEGLDIVDLYLDYIVNKLKES
ncbi:MAG: ATP-grasp domain-containing protein [Oscillospiraceae bacterium]|nr:ATP-grasp domain-containing protein [Oscillospiraceae bacterium]